MASAALRVGDIGVPQGSILAPIWYIILTNELPEVAHFHNCKEKQENQNKQQQENKQEERGLGLLAAAARWAQCRVLAHAGGYGYGLAAALQDRI